MVTVNVPVKKSVSDKVFLFNNNNETKVADQIFFSSVDDKFIYNCGILLREKLIPMDYSSRPILPGCSEYHILKLRIVIIHYVNDRDKKDVSDIVLSAAIEGLIYLANMHDFRDDKQQLFMENMLQLINKDKRALFRDVWESL